MRDFPTSICPHCGEPIGHRFFVRPVDDEHPEHLDCHQRARRDAASTDAVLPERRGHARPRALDAGNATGVAFVVGLVTY